MAPKKRVARSPRKVKQEEDPVSDEEPLKKRTRTTRKKSEKAKEIEEELKLSIKKESSKKNERKSERSEASPTQRTSIRKSTLLLDSFNPTSTPISPSKRLSSIGSRIPSPVKKNLTSRLNENIDLNRADLTSIQALQSRNIPRLSSLIDDLKTIKQKEIFDNYKSSVDLQLHAAKDLISSLTKKNHELQQELSDTKALLKSEPSITPTKQNGQLDEQDFLANELILDMMEQIVGLRIHRVEDTDEALFFDCSQSGKNGILDYRLTISKEDSSEIIYSPLENKEQDVDQLKEYLPEYFFDDLTFPLETLQQFYHKIYRGLSK